MTKIIFVNLLLPELILLIIKFRW